MSQGRSYKDKTPVLGILQRGGRLVAFVLTSTKVIPIQSILRSVLLPTATLISDEYLAYHGMSAHCRHFIVNHGRKEYVNRDHPFIHTNTIEGFWGIMKRGINGIYNWISKRHLQKYVEEFVFRYNTRKLKEAERFCLFLCNIEHRLKYKNLIEIP